MRDEGPVRVLCGEVLPALEVHWITGDDHDHARNALLAADRRLLSLVDCSSVHVMRTWVGFDAHLICGDHRR